MNILWPYLLGLGVLTAGYSAYKHYPLTGLLSCFLAGIRGIEVIVLPPRNSKDYIGDFQEVRSLNDLKLMEHIT
jgi:hypothetical protein